MQRYFSFSNRLLLATWPFVLTTSAAFLVWVFRTDAAQNERLTKLEMFGPLAGERFTFKDAGALKGQILTEVRAIGEARDSQIQAKLETIQHAVIRMEVQLASILDLPKDQRKSLQKTP